MLCEEMEPDIMCFSDTWLISYIEDSDVYCDKSVNKARRTGERRTGTRNGERDPGTRHEKPYGLIQIA